MLLKIVARSKLVSGGQFVKKGPVPTMAMPQVFVTNLVGEESISVSANSSL